MNGRSKNIVFNIKFSLKKKPVVPSHIPDVSVDGKELFTTMMAETSKLDPHVFLAIQKLKGKYLL